MSIISAGVLALGVNPFECWPFEITCTLSSCTVCCKVEKKTSIEIIKIIQGFVFYIPMEINYNQQFFHKCALDMGR